MAKKIEGYIKLQVPAGSATPRRRSARPGSARRQHHGILQGVQRRHRSDMEKGMPIPTVITVYARSRSPSSPRPRRRYLLKKAANLKSGSKEPGKVSAGTITKLAGARNRRSQDGDLNANDDRPGHEDHRRLCPFDGPRSGGGLRTWQS
jgi:large subunit ribosomal protein L11